MSCKRFRGNILIPKQIHRRGPRRPSMHGNKLLGIALLTLNLLRYGGKSENFFAELIWLMRAEGGSTDSGLEELAPPLAFGTMVVLERMAVAVRRRLAGASGMIMSSEVYQGGQKGRQLTAVKWVCTSVFKFWTGFIWFTCILPVSLSLETMPMIYTWFIRIRCCYVVNRCLVLPL